MDHSRSPSPLSLFSLLVLPVLLTPCLLAQDEQTGGKGPKPIPGIGPLGEIHRLHSGFAFTEGPAADRQGNCYFTDVRGNRIHKIDTQGKLTTFLEDSQGCNGLMFDAKGQLFACQGAAGRIIWIDPKTKKITPVVKTHDGKRFNRPNDIALDEHGGLYFTDPIFGRRTMPSQDKQCVYYVDGKGKATRLIDDLQRPNGVLLAPDGKTLYVLPSGPSGVGLRAYEVKAPGKLGPEKDLGGMRGDGLTADVKGNLYLTQGRFIVVVSPEGKELGRIEFPQQPSNCSFAGKDFDYLVVTARTSVYAVKMAVRGYQICRRK